jgi:hypothetical protein
VKIIQEEENEAEYEVEQEDNNQEAFNNIDHCQ